MPVLAGALLIFMLRICDVSVGTLRVMFMVRSNRLLAALMSIGEASIYILAISRVLKSDVTPPMLIGYACGYATGTAVGITLERWIAIGSVIVRVISPSYGPEIRDALLAENYGVTSMRGEGRDGEVLILFAVTRRRGLKRLLECVRRLDEEAFMTIEPIAQAIGGHQPVAPILSGVEK